MSTTTAAMPPPITKPTTTDANLLTSLKRPRNSTLPKPSSPTAHAVLNSGFPKPAPVHNKRPAYTNSNSVPRTANRSVLHVGLTPGSLASRVLIVGDSARAALLAAHLMPRPSDNGRLFIHSSSRGFTTYTGVFENTPVSIIAFGMGSQMIDFLVRECREVAPPGPMVIVSYGSCGGVKSSTPVGTVNVIDSCVLVTRNPDAWTNKTTTPEVTDGIVSSFQNSAPYRISQCVRSNVNLTRHLYDFLKNSVGANNECVMGNAFTTDSFYSSQGRSDRNFEDRNKNLVSSVLSMHAEAKTMDMESFHLLDVSRCAVAPNLIAAACAVVVVANRQTGEVIDVRNLAEVEGKAGTAILRSLANINIGELFEGVDIDKGGEGYDDEEDAGDGEKGNSDDGSSDE